MKNGCVVDISSIQAAGNDALISNKVWNESILENHLKRVRKLDFDKYIITAYKGADSKNIKQIAKKSGFDVFDVQNREGNIQDILAAADQASANYGFSNIMLSYGDSPFFDSDESRKLFQLHLDSAAEYSFGDDYPDGIIGEMFSRDIK